ncbi:MAG: site-specific DNA-methyltransferase [Bacteroidales bacterium]|jgi:adenine-specific DNA-methyltransferase|nr:site-specific DNA-methyltransferase [Bacteroidales bacterium]
MINKQELISKIQLIEGLSNEERSSLIELLRTRKKYGLVWEDKPEDVEEQLRNELPVFKEVKERAIVSDAPDAPNHILIEGDNLHALTALTYTHSGKIDVIYIDPPYNTGNKDFVYNDQFVDAEDSYRHSKWLSFMNKRLKIAKQLLSDKGVIFISIDENEVGPLRLLGDDIFLSKNFVGQWNWFKSATPPALSKKIKRTVEYILCWQSPNNEEVFRGVQKTSKSNDPFTKPQNTFKILTFPANSIKCYIEDGTIPVGVYGTAKFPNELLDDIHVKHGVNSNPVRFKNRFIWIQETLSKNINDGLYIELSKNGVLSYKRSEYNREVPPNFIDSSVDVDTTENAGRLLLDIFDNVKTFDYPKPVSLIQYLINFTEDKRLTILDFFAGSGTTLHATMKLNAEDGGHRQCILVTNNENQICENVTYERNRRVIQGYTTPKGEAVAGLSGNNLRYYKTDFIPREQTARNKRALVAAATDLLCIRNDIYTESKEFGVKRLRADVARYFSDGKQQMLIIYNEEAIPAFVDEISRMTDDTKIKVYVFAAGNYAYDDEFEEVSDKVTLCALPAAIYNAYQKVLPKKRAKMLDEANTAEVENANGELNFQEE